MNPNIVLPQSFSLLDSLFLITGITTITFSLKFLLLSHGLMNFYKTPSIVIFGNNPEKTGPLINRLSKNKVFSHPESDKIKFSISNIKNKKLQFIEMPISVIKEKRLLDIFNKVNFKGMIFFLDDSKSFKMMENQIKEIESINTLLDGKPNFFVVDNLDESSEVNKTYKVFVNKDENIEMLREKLASSIS